GGGPPHPAGERAPDHHRRHTRGRGAARGSGASGWSTQRGLRMSILLDEQTAVIVQGFTGDKGTFHAKQMIAYGTNVVGGVSPGKAMLGIMPGHIYMRGTVGLVTRSGTLGYEAAAQMQALGVGISTSVGIGGDPINGSSFVDILALFQEDPETDAVMMIGEIG